ncbi:MAG: S-layer homology domain-containing protein [Oscillospiraceae bacterium]|jgi:hypothetical protein|nr:S-layer homology domain-containing protein [Oscillospiraceae bacterium]
MSKTKRLLALILALATVLVMFTGVTAFAEEDAEDTEPAIELDEFAGVPKDTEDYEAITVLHAAGIIDGRDDGTYHPADKITRAEAAKLIAYAALSAAVAKRLPTNAGTTFTDIDAANQFASGAIAYLTQEGALHGTNYEQTLFSPGDDITGAEAMKILLGVLGYGANDEFVGTLWDTNAITHAAVLGLSKGVETEYSAPATRKDVARYIFNALTIQRVYFDDVTHTYVTGAVWGERVITAYSWQASYGYRDTQTQVYSATGFSALSNAGYTKTGGVAVVTMVTGYLDPDSGDYIPLAGALAAAVAAEVKTIVTLYVADGKNDDINGDGVVNDDDQRITGYAPVSYQTTQTYRVSAPRLNSLMQINGLSRVQLESETRTRNDVGELVTPLGYLYYRWEKAVNGEGITEWAKDVANEKVLGEFVVNPDRTNAAGPFLLTYEGIPVVNPKTYAPLTEKTFVNGAIFNPDAGIYALAGLTGLKVVVLDQRLSGEGVYNPITGNIIYEGKTLNDYDTWEFDNSADKFVAYFEIYGEVSKIKTAYGMTTYTLDVSDYATLAVNTATAFTKDELSYIGAAGLFSKDDKVRIIPQLEMNNITDRLDDQYYTNGMWVAGNVIRVEKAEVVSSKVSRYGYTAPNYTQDFWNAGSSKYNHVLLTTEKTDKTWINFAYNGFLAYYQFGNTKSVKKLVLDEFGYVIKGLEETDVGNFGIITSISYTSQTNWDFDGTLGILKGDTVELDGASLWKYTSLTDPTNLWNRYLDKLNAKVGIAVEYDGADMIRLPVSGPSPVITKGKIPAAVNSLTEIGDGAFWVRFELGMTGIVGTPAATKAAFASDLYVDDEIWYFVDAATGELIGAAAWAYNTNSLFDATPYAYEVYYTDTQRYLTLGNGDVYTIGASEGLTITGQLSISGDAELDILGDLTITKGAVVDLTGADIGGFAANTVGAIGATGLTVTTEADLISDLFDALGMEVGASLKLTVEQLEETLGSNDYFNADAGVVTFTKTTAGNAYSTPTVTGNASGAYHTLKTTLVAADYAVAAITNVTATNAVATKEVDLDATLIPALLNTGLNATDAGITTTVIAWVYKPTAIDEDAAGFASGTPVDGISTISDTGTLSALGGTTDEWFSVRVTYTVNSVPGGSATTLYAYGSTTVLESVTV